MKRVVFELKTADFKQGKFIDEKMIAVVASTKSENNFADEIKKGGKIIASETATDLFVDKAKFMKAIDGINLAEMLPVGCDCVEKVREHIKTVLNGGCLFKVSK